jgi:thioredoxin reductase (NADPH)
VKAYLIKAEGRAMGKPALFIVDGDTNVRQAMERDLRRRFGADYRVIAAESPTAALKRVEQMSRRGIEVALLMTDQWTTGMTGVEFLRHAQQMYPGAQRGVLVTYGDWSTVAPLQEAATLGQIDFFLFKPWAHPDEWLYPMIGEYLSRWAKTQRPRFEAFQVIGEQWAPRSHEVRDRLERNAVPYGFYPHDSDEGRRILEAHHLDASQLPVVIFFMGQVLINPSNADLAHAMGVATQPTESSYDVAIVGAGPAGLSAAVYAASEGLRTVVVESQSLGGQAGTTSLIRNYLGFPMGLRGEELTTKAYQQALLFGANFIFTPPAIKLTSKEGDFVVSLADGGKIVAHAVVVATGVEYRPIGVPRLEALKGAGVFYGAAVTEARAMRGKRVAVVGAGNSAGQAAIYLAKYADQVTLLVRGDSLAKSMSDYLTQEMHGVPNIDVYLQTHVVEAIGRTQLEGVVVRDGATGQTMTMPVEAVFIMIGGEPRTEWLEGTVHRDRRGYIVTGIELMPDGTPPAPWTLDRPPFMLETSLPGVFAVGDVRAGSVKRVASSVGEGSVVISFVHQWLQERGRTARMETSTPPFHNKS